MNNVIVRLKLTKLQKLLEFCRNHCCCWVSLVLHPTYSRYPICNGCSRELEPLVQAELPESFESPDSPRRASCHSRRRSLPLGGCNKLQGFRLSLIGLQPVVQQTLPALHTEQRVVDGFELVQFAELWVNFLWLL